MNRVAGVTPCVAVLIPAFDAAATVARAVASALAQAEAAEVVVVDDGSRDETARIAQACDDGSGRLRVLRQANRGPAHAVNSAYDASTAPHVCVLDADDFFLPGRLGAIFGHLGDDWDMAADRLLIAAEGAEDGPYRPWGMRLPTSGRVSFVDFVLGNLADPKRPRSELGYLQPVLRRAFLDAHGLRHDENLRLGEDYLLYAEALACGARFHVADDYGYVAVARPASLSHRHTAADLGALLEADLRLARRPGLTAADRRALRTHIANTRRRWIYHLTLEAKAAGRLHHALGALIGHPDTVGYVLAQTARAKLAGRRREPARGAATA